MPVMPPRGVVWCSPALSPPTSQPSVAVQVTRAERDRAKAITYALIYGLGHGKLGEDLGITAKVGGRLTGGQTAGRLMQCLLGWPTCKHHGVDVACPAGVHLF